MVKKSFLTSFVVILSILPIEVMAQTFLYGKLYYKKLTNTTCKVTASSNNIDKYSGDIYVPKTVSYNGQKLEVTGVDYQAFYNGINITSIILPETVKNIEGLAFGGCYSINEITIPKATTSIDDSAFDGCTSLVAINVEKDNTAYCSIDGQLYSKSMDRFVRFPGGHPATVCNIPESVLYIGESAFERCQNIEEIKLPSKLSFIGSNAFSQAIGLKKITIDADNPYFSTENGALYNKDKSKIILLPARCDEFVDLPSTVREFGTGACANNFNIQKITIPEGVTSLGTEAFWNSGVTLVELPSTLVDLGFRTFEYSKLRVIKIPNGVTSLRDFSFMGCPYLQQVELPSTLLSIGMMAFADVPLLEITIPASVSYIGEKAFDNCWLNKVNVLSETPPSISSNSISSSVPIYVPEQSLAAYKSHPVWGNMNIAGPVSEEVLDVNAPMVNNSPAAFFSLSGEQLSAPRKGVNIVRRGGITKKVVY